MSINSNSTPGDVITSLPTDSTIPNHDEIRILETLFKQKEKGVNRIFEQTKDVFLIGILFIAFSLPQIDEMIHKIFPSTSNSIYITIFIKALGFMLIYFIIKNWYLCRK